MKSYIVAGLFTAQMIVAAQPAAAARFDETLAVQAGTFAGARIRLSLGGNQQDRKFRAGMAVAPTLRRQTISGDTRMRLGEGVELGFARDRPLALSFGGRPVRRYLPGGSKAEVDQLGLSTGGKVAIGVGVALMVAGGVFLAVASDECRGHEGCEF